MTRYAPPAYRICLGGHGQPRACGASAYMGPGEVTDDPERVNCPACLAKLDAKPQLRNWFNARRAEALAGRRP